MAIASDLDGKLGDARDGLREVRRAVVELTREYHRLDAADLAVDELGDPITAQDALASVRAALVDVQSTLAMADDAFDVAKRYTSRLKER